MNFKRTIIILLLVAVLVGFLFTIKKSDDPVRTECIIQSDQVVLNQFVDDVLYGSLSVSGNKITTWRKGKVKPDVRTYATLQIFHYTTIGQQNDQIIGLENNVSEMIFYGRVTFGCVQALQSTISKNAL